MHIPTFAEDVYANKKKNEKKLKWMPLRRSRGGMDSVVRGGGGGDGGGRRSQIGHAAFVSQVACGVRSHTLVAKGLMLY